MPAEQSTPLPRYVLAIDLGSTGPKVGVVDENGRLAANTVEHTTTYFLPNGGAEQDPHEWWSAISRAAKKALQQCGAPPEAILAVSVTAQWATTVAIDENGEPLMNAIHWMDSRGAPYNRAITTGFPNLQGYGLGRLLKWIALTGIVPTHSGVDSLGHILFLENERQEIYRRTFKFLEPMDYINLRLTGRCAASQLTVMPMILADNRDPDRREYHPWLLKVSGVDRAKLPELLPNDGILGTVTPSIAAEWGLSPQTVVIMPSNDNHTAAIGSGALADFEAVVVLGTSGFLAGHLPFRKADLFHMLSTMPCPFRGRTLILAELGNNGKVLESFLKNIVYGKDEFEAKDAPEDMYERASRTAGEVAAGSEGVLFLPWFNGILAPADDKYMRGDFLNLSHRTTRAHLTRALLEGTAFNWKWMIGAIEKFNGRRFEFLRLSGGGAQSEVWAQIMADVLDIPLHKVGDPLAANVRGAALLAFHRLGMLEVTDIPKRVEIERVFTPRPEHRPLYDRLYTQFRAAYPRLKPICHALNR